MPSEYGNNIKVAVYGGSHTESVGVAISGIPRGKRIDLTEVQAFLNRRAPGQSELTSARKEEDTPIIISGLVGGITDGNEIKAEFKNSDTRPSDYEKLKDIPRPSHADYPARIKYGEGYDGSGGGQFSARLTLPICFAGAICLSLLRETGIEIAAHIASVGAVSDERFNPAAVSRDELERLRGGENPTLSKEAFESMKRVILSAKAEGDSVGGTVECCVLGLPAGKGEPLFGGIEGRISSAVFAIPAVKGIEFGNGFEAARLKGSENNDAYCIDRGEIRTRTNNHGGILGGLSTGMPLIFRVAFKPTPSIAKEQDSVSLTERREVKLKIEGRHDPCVVLRAVPCVEAAAALAIYDLLIG